jgi:hypothetical protein
MKFRYIGDKENMKVFGYDFSGGQTPDVTDENAIKRLQGNHFFEVVDASGSQDSGGFLMDDHTLEEFSERISQNMTQESAEVQIDPAPEVEQPGESESLFPQDSGGKKGGKK